jgi:hypothetical protein
MTNSKHPTACGHVVSIFYIKLIISLCSKFVTIILFFVQVIFDNILNRNIPWPNIPEDMSDEAADLIDRYFSAGMPFSWPLDLHTTVSCGNDLRCVRF